jgi:hypothetical protein
MKNLKATKELIKKHTGCDKIMKEGSKYILFYIRHDIKTASGKPWYDHKELHQDEVRNIYLEELGI